jgi:hypothetical protein
MPLAWFSPSSAYALWFSTSALCLVASLYLLFGRLDRRHALLYSLAALGFTPLADNFRWAQSQVFVMFGVLLFFRLIQRGRDDVAAVLLAAMGLLRGFPLVLGGYLIARRQWRAIIILALAFALGVVATIAITGIAPAMNFLRVLGIIGGNRWFSLGPRWEFAAANVSLDAFLARASLGSHSISFAIKLVALALAFYATRASSGDRDGRALSVWIVTMLVLTPVVWLHYLVLLIIPFSLIAVASKNDRVSARTRRFAISAFCVVDMAVPLMSTLTFRSGLSDWRARVGAELGFAALMFAWVAAWRFATEPSGPSGAAGPLLEARRS